METRKKKPKNKKNPIKYEYLNKRQGFFLDKVLYVILE